MPANLTPHHIPPEPVQVQHWPNQLYNLQVVLVRHAERAAAPAGDPPLTAAGKKRALLLASMFQYSGLAAVFASQFQRSAQTGTPAASAAGLTLRRYQAADTAGLLTVLRTEFAGKLVLVVAHSDTVDAIAAGLGMPGIGLLPDTAFDRMFILTRTWCGARLLRLNYGKPTP